MRRMENTGQTMEYVIQHSFQQYQFERTLPDKQVLPCMELKFRLFQTQEAGSSVMFHNEEE